MDDSLFKRHYPSMMERTIEEKQRKLELLKSQVKRLEDAIEFQVEEEKFLNAAREACEKLEAFRKSRGRE